MFVQFRITSRLQNWRIITLLNSVYLAVVGLWQVTGSTSTYIHLHPNDLCYSSGYVTSFLLFKNLYECWLESVRAEFKIQCLCGQPSACIPNSEPNRKALIDYT
jgi:hypothetical protein